MTSDPAELRGYARRYGRGHAIILIVLHAHTPSLLPSLSLASLLLSFLFPFCRLPEVRELLDVLRHEQHVKEVGRRLAPTALLKRHYLASLLVHVKDEKSDKKREVAHAGKWGKKTM